MDNTPRPLFANSYDLGHAFTGGLSLGYGLRKLRLELEYFGRHHENGTVPLLTAAGTPAPAGKTNDWSPVGPPTESVSDFSSPDLVVNA